MGMLVAMVGCIFVFQAEDGIRYLVRSRGLGDVYKRQVLSWFNSWDSPRRRGAGPLTNPARRTTMGDENVACLLYTSDAADERSSVDLGGRRIIKKKKSTKTYQDGIAHTNNQHTNIARNNTTKQKQEKTQTTR